jgi:hypothetical protein
MPDNPTPRSRWFWVNLGAVCVLAPLFTYWFQRHLQLYFTEIVVVGGAFTLWALVRMIWGIVEKAADVDAWRTSRTLLGSPLVTQGLLAAALAFVVLWWSTGSLYLQLQGGSGDYVVEVVRNTDGSPLIERVALNAGRPVVGLPRLLRRELTELQCRIVEPVQFEPIDCDLAPGRATRVAVPRDFPPKEYHLVRIVPGSELYRNLPQDTDDPVTRYELTITRQRLHEPDIVARVPDLRQQTLLLGALEAEMPLVLRLHDAQNYEHFLDTRLRAAMQDRDSASLMAAILSTSTRVLPDLYVKADDVLTLNVTFARTDEGSAEQRTFEGFPVTHKVTSDQVQTLWLSPI